MISIHALRVEGDGCMRFKDLQAKISIHALRVEGDRSSGINEMGEGRFLSTPSGWRATVPVKFIRRHLRISIHALRVEGDSGIGSSSR